MLTLETPDKYIADFEINGSNEKFHCDFMMCDNPTCGCRSITLTLTPLSNTESDHPQKSKRVDIDIFERKLSTDTHGSDSNQDLEFAEQVLDNLDEEDFEALTALQFNYKNKITEESSLNNVTAWFDYAEVEMNGSMYAYSEIFPFGTPLTFELDGENYFVDDQYCVKSNCSCTDAYLNILKLGEIGPERVCVAATSHKTRQWDQVEGNFSLLSIETLKKEAEEQIPEFYQLLKKRHEKLKTIYANSREKDYTPVVKPVKLEVGRNDPCPCGSGKKYKKCCLKK